MNSYLFPGLQVSPVIIERLMERVHPDRMDLPTHPGRFSPREVAAHLADWEPILLGRMKSCKESPGATIQGLDEGVLAVEHGYAASDWREQCRLFAKAREETIAWLKTLGEADWDLQGIHSERGRITIGDQANALLGHDLYHVEQLSHVIEGRSVGTW